MYTSLIALPDRRCTFATQTVWIDLSSKSQRSSLRASVVYWMIVTKHTAHAASHQLLRGSLQASSSGERG